jgi:DNA mismatch endonuclease (patch repair protein)
MARVKQRDSKPELVVRRLLHSLGYRFRLHRKDLPGTPDIVLPSRKIVILVHGCFWHRHEGCRFATTPKTRIAFWQDKFERNKKRDAEVINKLRSLGWRIITVWQCETYDLDSLTKMLKQNIK